MKKLIIIITIIAIPLWVFYYKKDDLLLSIKKEEVKNQQIVTIEENTWAIEENTPIVEEPPKDINKEMVRQKIERLRKKDALKSAIRIWEAYLDNKEYVSALPKYLSILKEIPNDESIIQQTGHIYFALKKFQNAYRYYERIKEYKNLDKSLAINALIASKINILTPKNVEDLKKEIMTFPLSEEEKFYHINSLWCIWDLTTCKQNFSDYFKNILEKEGKIVLEELKNIQTSFTNYENFKLDDVSYQNALVTGSFFSNGAYPIAINTGKEILKEKTDYKPIIKILAKSYFELWEYTKAKEYLLKYNEIDHADPEVSYLLWVIYGKLHDYVLSSVHLKNSIEIWYIESIDERRRIIYNYNKVWEIDKMLWAFKDMIVEDKNISIEDIDLALYHHITNQKIKEAKEIVEFALSKYTTKNTAWEIIIENGDTLYWYLWWIQIEEKDVEWSREIAEKNLKKWLELNAENPMIHFIIWKLQLEKERPKTALMYFNKTIELWTIDEFSKLAKEEIEKLDLK